MRPPGWITSCDKGATAVVDFRRKDRTTGVLVHALLVNHLGYRLDDVARVVVSAPGTVTVVGYVRDGDGRFVVDGDEIATEVVDHDVVWPAIDSSGPASSVASAPGPDCGPPSGTAPGAST